MGDRRSERQWQVTGHVQGVGFRWSTRREAERLQLDGWVRNEPDGSVRLRARGEPGQLDALEEWLHRGPPPASVHEVRREGKSDTEGAELRTGGFEIRH